MYPVMLGFLTINIFKANFRALQVTEKIETNRTYTELSGEPALSDIKGTSHLKLFKCGWPN